MVDQPGGLDRLLTDADVTALPDDSETYLDVRGPMPPAKATDKPWPPSAHLTYSYRSTIGELRARLNKVSPEVTAQRWVTADGVRVRSAAEITASNILGVLNTGAQVLITDEIRQGSSLSWSRLAQKDAQYPGAWIATQFLSSVAVAPAALPITFPAGGRKVGVHLSPSGDQKGFLRLAATLDSLGKPLPSSLILGPDGPLLGDVLRATPSTRLVYRHWYPWGADGLRDYDPGWQTTDYQTGRNFAAWYFDHFTDADKKLATWHQLHNEPSIGYDAGRDSFGLLRWTLGTLDEAEARGFNLCILNLPGGYPARPNERDKDGWQFWLHRETLTMLRDRVIASWARGKIGHVVGLHEYDLAAGAWQNEFDLWRHESIRAALPADVRNFPLVLNEFGQRSLKTINGGEFITKIKMARARLSRDPNLIGAFIWCWGYTHGFEGDDCSGLAPEFIQALS